MPPEQRDHVSQTKHVALPTRPCSFQPPSSDLRMFYGDIFDLAKTLQRLDAKLVRATKPMTYNNLGRHSLLLMPNSASESLFKFVRRKSILFPFARSPSTRYPLPSFPHKLASPSALSGSYAMPHVRGSQTARFPCLTLLFGNGDFWWCVVRTTTR